MATSLDQWMREFNEASRLSDEINAMISQRVSLPPSGPETQRQLTAMRRKITILRTRLENLEALLSKLPSIQPIKDKELHKRREMLSNLKSKATQMASMLNMSNFGNREDLLGDSKKPVDVATSTAELDNQGIVGLQRQIMREQDEALEKLEETVLSTKHIALAVNEELDLHTRLIDDLDQRVDVADSRLQFHTESSKGTSNPQQAHKRWLFVHVSAHIHRCNCSSDCCGLGSYQVLVGGGEHQECYNAIFKCVEFQLVFAYEALFVELHTCTLYRRK